MELELLQDADMYTFFEDGIRGGISMISHRYARANNQYIPECFDSHYKPSVFIIYLDANNLYGHAMSRKLPMGEFKYVDDDVIAALTEDTVKLMDADGDRGYVFEVDLHYPEHLHDMHNGYPLAPEGLNIGKEMLSDYCKGLKDKLDAGVYAEDNMKLTPNFRDKERYVVHLKNLQFYLEQGMKLKKVHRVMEFKQGDFMSGYIGFNTEMRKKAKNSFEKDLFKLMNNSVFGKTMENVRGLHGYRAGD